MAAASELRGDVLACSEVNELSGDVGGDEVAAYLESATVIQLVFQEAAVIGTGPGAEAFVACRLVGAGAVVVVEAVEESKDGLLEGGLAGLVEAVEEVEAGGQVGLEGLQTAEARKFDTAQPHRGRTSRLSKASRP